MKDNKMKNLNLFFLMISVIAMVACGKKTDEAKVIEQQRELTAKWVKAINAGDIEALTSLFDENTVRMNQNEPILIGKKAVVSHLKSRGEKFNSNEDCKVQNVVVSGDYTIAWGSYNGDYKNKSDGSIFHDEGKWVDVRKLQPDGSWKLIIDIWNSDLPVVKNN